ncbi:helix-turn-helix domain-containing protein [Ferroplasma sp.]|uniref:helix-turn-helix domain-containing protein n=1 Tax=Ferroplasma sp. TaxID=2591003 RepID=UPI00307D6316
MGSFNQILDDNASCRDIFEYFFDLSPADVSVLYSLANKKGESLESIASIMKKERTAVFRSLQRLVSTGLVIKKKNILKKGGYYYVYLRISPPKITELVKIRENEFHSALVSLLKDIENDFKN